MHLFVRLRFGDHLVHAGPEVGPFFAFRCLRDDFPRGHLQGGKEIKFRFEASAFHPEFYLEVPPVIRSFMADTFSRSGNGCGEASAFPNSFPASCFSPIFSKTMPR